MKVVQTIQGIKPSPAFPKKTPFVSFSPIVEPAEGRLVLPSPNATLQVYDVFRDRQAAELQVAPRNFTAPPKQGQELPAVRGHFVGQLFWMAFGALSDGGVNPSEIFRR